MKKRDRIGALLRRSREALDEGKMLAAEFERLWGNHVAIRSILKNWRVYRIDQDLSTVRSTRASSCNGHFGAALRDWEGKPLLIGEPFE